MLVVNYNNIGYLLPHNSQYEAKFIEDTVWKFLMERQKFGRKCINDYYKNKNRPTDKVLQ